VTLERRRDQLVLPARHPQAQVTVPRLPLHRPRRAGRRSEARLAGVHELQRL